LNINKKKNVNPLSLTIHYINQRAIKKFFRSVQTEQTRKKRN